MAGVQIYLDAAGEPSPWFVRKATSRNDQEYIKKTVNLTASSIISSSLPPELSMKENCRDYIGGNVGLTGRALVRGRRGRRAGTPTGAEGCGLHETEQVGDAWTVRTLRG